MTARTVRGYVEFPVGSGQPCVGARVVAQLYTGSDGQAAYGLNDDGVPIGSTATLTNGAGTWSLELEPNEDIEPAGTVWQITIQPPDHATLELGAIEVPDTAGTHDVVDLLTELPGALPSQALRAHLADTGAHVPSGTVVSTTATQTLSNKTLATPTITGGLTASAAAAKAIRAAILAQRADGLDVRDFEPHGDGVTDDAATIQLAEDTAAALAVALGQRVPLNFGSPHYAVSTTVQKKTGVDWTGAAKIRRRDNAAPTGSAWPVVAALSVDDWSITGLTIEAIPHDRFLSSGISWTGASTNAYNVGVEVRDCERFSIRNCTIRAFTCGVRTRGSKTFLYSGNVLSADTTVGNDALKTALLNGTYATAAPWSYAASGGFVTLWEAGTPPVPNQDFIITQNWVYAYGIDVGIEAHSQSFQPGTGIVSLNHVEGCHSGIQAYIGSFVDDGTITSVAQRIVITSNVVKWTYEQGIYVRAVGGVVVANNRLYRNAIIGVGGSGGSAGGIVTRINPSAVATLSVGVTYETGNLIDGNIVEDTGDPTAGCDGAIHLRTPFCRVTNNKITRSATLFSTKTGTGILIDNGDHPDSVAVSGNEVDNFGIGIFFSGVRNVVRADQVVATVTFNDVRNCAQGVHANLATRPVVRFNRIDGCTTSGISVRNSIGPVFEYNAISRSAIGIRIDGGCHLGAEPYILNPSVSTANVKRGGSVVVRFNTLVGCTTSYGITETAQGVDTSFHGRCAIWEGDTVDGVPLESTSNVRFSSATAPSGSTLRTWHLGQETRTSAPASGAAYSRVCTSPGQYGHSTATTGDTTSGSAVITNVASFDGYGVGLYVTVSGFSGTRRITAFDVAAATITLDATASATATGVSLTPATPTFALLASVP